MAKVTLKNLKKVYQDNKAGAVTEVKDASVEIS